MSEPQQPPLFTTADLREAARTGLLTLGAYLLGTFALLALVLGFVDGSDFPLTWLKATVIAAALGLRGRLVLDVGGDGRDLFLGSSLSYGVTPLLLLALATGLAFLIARRSERVDPTGTTREAVVRAVLSAAVATAVLAVLARLSHLDDDVLDEADGSSAGAAADAILLYGLPLLAIAFAAGRLSAHRRGLRAELARRTAGVSSWFGTTALHAAVSSGGLVVVGLVYLLVTSRREVHDSFGSITHDDVSGTVLFVYALPNLALAATGFFQGFSIGSRGETVGLLGGHVPAHHYLWALVVLASALVVGTRRALRHPHPGAVYDGWWRAGLGSLAFWSVAAFVLHVRYGAALFSGGVGYTASTLVPLGFGWGVLLLVAGRWAAPQAQALLPGLAGPVVVPLPAGAPEAELPTPGTDLLGSPAPRNPPSRRTVAVAVLALALLVAGVVGYQVADSRLYGPDAVARAYLDDLAAGRLTSAVSRLAHRPTDRALLVDAALPAGSRISSPRIDRVEQHGRLATAHVSFTVAGRSESGELLLVRRGHRGLVFHDWQVAEGPGALTIAGAGPDIDEVTLNGITVSAGDDHPAFPGVYALELPGDLFASDTDSVTMTFDDEQEGISAELSAETEARATEAVVRYLQACLAKATTLQTGCGFSSYRYADRFENVHWRLLGEPDLSFDYSDGEIRVRGATVEARVTGTAVSRGFFGEPDAREPLDETSTAYLSGTVSLTGDTATFSPS